MEALYLLIPLSLAFVALAAWIFLRMSDSGQFDDLDSPAWSILHDDDHPAKTAESSDDANDGNEAGTGLEGDDGSDASSHVVGTGPAQ